MQPVPMGWVLKYELFNVNDSTNSSTSHIGCMQKFPLDRNMCSLYCLLQVYMHSVSQYCGTFEPVAAVLVPEAMLDVLATGSFGWVLKH